MQLMQPGNFLSRPHNISLTWNCDGVPVFKSSKFRIWSLYINFQLINSSLMKILFWLEYGLVFKTKSAHFSSTIL